MSVSLEMRIIQIWLPGAFTFPAPQLKVVNIDVNRKHRIVGQVLTSFFIFIVFYSNVCDVQGKIHLTDEV